MLTVDFLHVYTRLSSISLLESLRAQGILSSPLSHTQEKPRSSDYVADLESTSSHASRTPKASGSKKRTFEPYLNSKGKHRAVSEESYDEDELFRRLVVGSYIRRLGVILIIGKSIYRSNWLKIKKSRIISWALLD